MKSGANEKFFYSPVKKHADALNTWFCFPADYNIGMSSLGFLYLYSLLDKNPNVHPERVFLDTSCTKLSVNELDLISFSFSFEFDFLNIFKFLEKNKIPIYASERDDRYPLVMGGGAVLTSNPEPFKKMFDFIMIGDGDELLNEVADLLYETKELSKLEKLKKLAELEGCYVPILQNFSDIKRRVCTIKQCVFSPIVTFDTAFCDTFLIEVVRGCPFKCNFCMTSHINNPPKYSDFESIKNAINIGVERCSNIGLLGALVPANPCFEDLCKYLLELHSKKNFKLSIGSLRADFITPLNIKTLTTCGQKTATIAIEAGSQKMRDFINKKLTEEQILNAAETCFQNGLEGLKLYAMVGFPDETEDDLSELMRLVRKIKQNKKLSLSINSFVPKMQTPFAHYNMENSKSLEKKFNFLRKESHKSGIAFRPCSIAWNEIQGVISTGDNTLFEPLYLAFKDGATIGAFRKNFRKVNIKKH